MGADSAIRIDTRDALHPLRVAQLLKELIGMKGFDFVIMGKQAIDDDYNQTVCITSPMCQMSTWNAF